MSHRTLASHPCGFTLIEMSIVLVVIGLIIGGILTGRELIDAAAQRAQIAQIVRFNTAIRTFQGKYGYLPGDIPDPYASSFGFATRGTLPGQGDGNGVLQGSDSANGRGFCVISGETLALWFDLSTAGLIGNGFSNSNLSTGAFPLFATSVNQDLYLPAAKIGNGNYVYVFSGLDPRTLSYNAYGADSYFGVAASGNFASTNDWQSFFFPGLTVQQAYNLDKKADDGLPQSGRVLAAYYNYSITRYTETWAAGGGVAGASPGTAAAASSTSCYDNGGSATATMQYSLSQNGGNAVNCALLFHLQ